MARRKAVKNELKDYLTESIAGTIGLSALFYVLNNYADGNIPYDVAPAAAFGLAAMNRWLPAKQFTTAVSTASRSVAVNGERMLLSSANTIFKIKADDQPQSDTLKIKYRDQDKKVILHKEILSSYLLSGFARQLAQEPAPFARAKFQGISPKIIWCCYYVTGSCGQFDSWGQGTSPRLVTRPYRAIVHISNLWPPKSN